jgi:hypothetical protein
MQEMAEIGNSLKGQNITGQKSIGGPETSLALRYAKQEAGRSDRNHSKKMSCPCHRCFYVPLLRE